MEEDIVDEEEVQSDAGSSRWYNAARWLLELRLASYTTHE